MYFTSDNHKDKKVVYFQFSKELVNCIVKDPSNMTVELNPVSHGTCFSFNFTRNYPKIN